MAGLGGFETHFGSFNIVILCHTGWVGSFVPAKQGTIPFLGQEQAFPNSFGHRSAFYVQSFDKKLRS